MRYTSEGAPSESSREGARAVAPIPKLRVWAKGVWRDGSRAPPRRQGVCVRDPERRRCVLFYAPSDFSRLVQMVRLGGGGKALKQRGMNFARQVKNFCEDRHCCRRVALLRHFEEDAECAGRIRTTRAQCGGV